MSSEPVGFSRRAFLEGTGAALLAVAPLSASSYARTLGANDKIGFALIGHGMRGNNHMDRLAELVKQPDAPIRIAAVCEIYERRKKELMERSGLPSCYHNYEDVLADPAVDAVIIAVPDHWHFKMSADAMRAGKHVYCEKPVTLKWEEARDLIAVQKETGMTFQVGAQSASRDVWRKAARFLGDGTNGIAGKLLHFQTSYNRNVPGGDWNYTIFEDGTEKTIDWTRWLGSATQRPFSAERFFRFRKYWDYSGGLATDLLYHQLSHMSVALNFPLPTRVAATGGNYVHKDREVPDTFNVSATFEGGFSGTLFSTAGNDQPMDELIRCEHGTIKFQGDNAILIPQGPYVDAVREGLKDLPEAEIVELPQGDKKLLKSVMLKGDRCINEGNLHLDNFMKAMRTGSKPVLDAEEGFRIMTTIALAVKSYREDRICKYDPVKREEIV